MPEKFFPLISSILIKKEFFRRDFMNIMTLDVGGTAIKSAYFTGTELLYSDECPSEARTGAARLLQNIYRLLDQALSIKPFDAIGISTTGQVDSDAGRIIYANETVPGYIGTCLKDLLEDRYQVPAYIENDVNAAALGEAYYGAGKDYSDFLCLTYGTGVGGAIITDHKLYKGHSGIAAEVGHMITHPNGLLCDCGHRGCYQQYASTTALVRTARELNPSLSNGRLIFDAMQSGDSAVKEIIDSWIDEISYGLLSLIYVFNPSAILLGGGIMNQHYIVGRLREIVAANLISSFTDVNLLPTALGNLAGVYGMRSVVEHSTASK